MKSFNDGSGFTLVELVIVIAIIGLLTAIAVPAYIGQQKRAQRSEAFASLQNLRLLEEQYYAENTTYTNSMGTAGANQAGNVALIQVSLPGFQPGNPLRFSYQIVTGQQITTTSPLAYTALSSCFTAIATGNSGTNVSGEVYAIDCNNIRNF